MSFAEYLYNLVDIIANYAVKEHYTDNGAGCPMEEPEAVNLSNIKKEYEKEKI